MVIGVLYVIGQYVILGWIGQKNTDGTISHGSSFDVITATVTIVQYILTAILILIIFQILTGSYYSTLLLIISTGISYTLGFAMMGLLAYRFFSWFRSNRNSVVLSYGLASAMFGVNLIVALIFVSSLLLNRPSEIREFFRGSLTLFWLHFCNEYTTVYVCYMFCCILPFNVGCHRFAITILFPTIGEAKILGHSYYPFSIFSKPVCYFISKYI